LFAPRDAYRFKDVAQPAAVEYDPTTGKNPPYGAAINFYLKANLERRTFQADHNRRCRKKVREIECRGPKPGAGEAKKPDEDEEFSDADRRLARPRPGSPGVVGLAVGS